MLKIVQTVQNCKECPNRRYFSGGVYECEKAGNVPLSREFFAIPEWCPLPNDSAPIAANAMFALENAKSVLKAAMKEAESASPERLREMIRFALQDIEYKR